MNLRLNHHAVNTLTLFLSLLLQLRDARAQDTTATLRTLIDALVDTNVDVRRNAVISLGEVGSGSEAVTRLLVKRLRDDNAGVRWHSAIALSQIGTATVPSLIRALRDSNVATRQGAARALGRITPMSPAALPSLILSLRDRDAIVREEAAVAIGNMGPIATPAISALVELFSDEEPWVSGKAADALSKIGKGSVPALIRALKDEDHAVRWCALIALGKIGADAREALPALLRALEDNDANVRYCAAHALGSLGDHAGGAVSSLLHSLQDRDEDVRRAADMALGEIDRGWRARGMGWSAAAAIIDSLTPSLMNELHVPGVSIVLVHDRTLVWSKSFGVRDVRTLAPVTRETSFEAASMTKPVFTYTVMKLVERGILDLDRPLIEYWKEKSVPDQPYRHLITARMVLSHTAGFPNWRKGEEDRDGPLPVMFKPGSRFSYSGEGVFFLQRVVEHLTGEPLESYAEQTLFTPLGLKHTSYVWTERLDAGLASGHGADGAFLQKTRYRHANASYTLYTTAEEYGRFLIQIMNTNRSAAHSLSRESVATMLSRQTGLDAREPVARPGGAEGDAVYWGLGWCINATREGDMFHHSGANRSGFRCFSQFSMSRGSGVVIMTNGVNGNELWSRLINTVGDL